jgi:hypothetical protein
MEFRELADERRLIREVCRKHASSLAVFKYPKGPSFGVSRPDPTDVDSRLHHVTTTATCIESLTDCHPAVLDRRALNKLAGRGPADPKHAAKELALKELKEQVRQVLVARFCAGALARDWTSEKSAPVYCACRALPVFVKGSAKWTEKHSALIKTIYGQLEHANRFGIGEKVMGNGKPSDLAWYPENAYHTYWALAVLGAIDGSNFRDEAETCVPMGLDRVCQTMRLWIRAKLSEEVALHLDKKSAGLDSDQLTWALAAFIKFEGNLSSDLRGQDLVRKAFEALASTQEPIGTWRHYRPLFIYSNAGNAYCYVYESFTFLLKAVLERMQEQEFLEDVMRQFVDPLRRLKQYADMTAVRLEGSPETVAWSSGHRPGSTQPEGWATASVFSFFQAYRRLLGILARRDALRNLPRPVLSNGLDPIVTLADRGDTWPLPGKHDTVAEDLITLFVNPVRRATAADGRDTSEPDDQPIRDDQARSAILFGPPGASKTTLAQNVASALGWDYVELHSSHFVVEGVPAVQRTADRIFAYLMELDHAVVLFDEPDELVREREDAADAFGRFLTTSMLPKLAQLWKQQRVIYFLATNHVRYFDAAIIRSERFDVLILVPPPSFSKKIVELGKRLTALTGASVKVTVECDQIDDSLRRLEQFSIGRRRPDAHLPNEMRLAKFILLRWDQIEELAFRIASLSKGTKSIVLDSHLMSLALDEIADDRLKRLQTYLDYLVDSRQVRRDFQRKPVFSVSNFLPAAGIEIPACIEQVENQTWLVGPSGTLPEALPGYRLEHTENVGEVKIVPQKSAASGSRTCPPTPGAVASPSGGRRAPRKTSGIATPAKRRPRK